VIYYVPDPANPSAPNRQAWAQTEAKKAVSNYLRPKLPGVVWQLDPDPPVAGTTTGDAVTVTIRVPNAALVLNLLNIPGFNPLPLTAATTMRME
jgi:tRNA A37 threonylcarbamoyladenosine synthetase subunit TsaC/SUA5/YrdC